MNGLPSITVTRADVQRLSSLLDTRVGMAYRTEGRRLRGELRRAVVVPPTDIAPSVVTMNSRLSFRDVARGEVREVRLVYPWDARDRGTLSIFSMAGTALLGLTVGMCITWPNDAAGRDEVSDFEVLAVHYQPEASGDWHL